MISRITKYYNANVSSILLIIVIIKEEIKYVLETKREGARAHKREREESGV